MKREPLVKTLRFASETRRRTRHVTSNPNLEAFVLELLDTIAARHAAARGQA